MFLGVLLIPRIQEPENTKRIIVLQTRFRHPFGGVPASVRAGSGIRSGLFRHPFGGFPASVRTPYRCRTAKCLETGIRRPKTIRKLLIGKGRPMDDQWSIIFSIGAARRRGNAREPVLKDVPTSRPHIPAVGLHHCPGADRQDPREAWTPLSDGAVRWTARPPRRPLATIRHGPAHRPWCGRLSAALAERGPVGASPA